MESDIEPVYAIIDKVNQAFDGFYGIKHDAVLAYRRHQERGASNIMLVEVIDSTGNAPYPNDLFWTQKGWSK